MKPYYERAGVTLYHGDCRDVLPHFEAASADLIVTDPPYGVGWESGLRRSGDFGAIVADDGSLDVPMCLRLALRTLRRGRHLYVFGPPDLAGLPVTETAELIWDKVSVGPGDLRSPWGPSHERIAFATHETSSVNRDRGYGRLAARLRRGSVLRHQRPTGRGAVTHPTEKPVGLLRELIESSSCIGETVLDPFVGVGSTLVAAQLEGRRAIGIEIEERYCEIAARRLSQDVLPLFEAAG